MIYIQSRSLSTSRITSLPHSLSSLNLNQLLNNVSFKILRSRDKRAGNTKIVATADPTTTTASSSGTTDNAGTTVTGPTIKPPRVYRRSTHPTSLPLNKLFSANFPLSVSESIEDYSFRAHPLKFQHDLLSLLPFYPHVDPITGRSSEVIQTEIEPGRFINEFVIYPSNFRSQDYNKLNHCIMIHGYGGGLGFFLKNFDQISKLKNWVIHSIDLLGYGCSSRPPFTIKSNDLNGVEHWFHDSFTKWLQIRKLDLFPQKNLIMAHSMGAYLMATYGIKYNPQFCQKLLMVSPGAVLKHRKQVPVPKYFAHLWEQNISPFTLVRKAGPLGSKLVSMWSSRRFANLPEREAKFLHRYAYGIFQAPGSGEYMLNYLLAPGADARHPLIERGIHKLNCKLLWCYGKEDWMDKRGGEVASRIINNLHKDNELSKVMEIEDSGHHVYLDNVNAFNEMMLKEMKAFDTSI